MDSQRASSPQSKQSSAKSIDEIQLWIINRLAKELRVDPEKLTVNQSILSLGIDSVQVVSVMSELEDWCEFRFTGNPLEDDATIHELALHVFDLTGKTP